MKIAMYMHGVHLPGGVGSYLRRMKQMLNGAGHEVLFFDVAGGGRPAGSDVTYVDVEAAVPRAALEAGATILHTHVLLRFTGPLVLPVIRTVHNHDAYCPSGSRFLATSGLPCNRTFSLCGCTWGHIVNRCGSVRPKDMLGEFRRAREEFAYGTKLSYLAVSEFVRGEMVRNGYSAARVRTLRLPAPNHNRSEPTSDAGLPRFVFLGRLTAQKGVDWLIRATALVNHDIAVDIAGAGHPAQEKEYRSLVEKLGLSSKITFHPWLDGTGVEALLRKARALVFPSVWHEPAGLVALEAMAMARAVIAGRVGGIPEIVKDGDTGMLIDPGHVETLAAAIDRLAADSGLARSLGNAGRERAAAEFSEDAHLSGLLGAYEEIISTYHRSTSVVERAV